MDKSSLPLTGLDPDTNSMNRIAWQMISACVGGGEGRCWFGAGAMRLVKMYCLVEQLLRYRAFRAYLPSDRVVDNRAQETVD
jgi:hypothetical protein